MRVLFDTNVVLDVLMDRSPFAEAASRLFAAVEHGTVGGYLGATTVTTVHYLTADFTQPLDLPILDGIVVANALHFQRYAAQEQVVQQFKSHLRPDGRLIVIEYNVDRGNHWVPYPLSYQSWVKLARTCGFGHTQLLAERSSRFLHAIYAAVSW